MFEGSFCAGEGNTVDSFTDVEKRPLHFCALIPSISPCPRQCQRSQPRAHGSRSSRGLEQGSERRDSGKSENSFPWDFLFVSAKGGRVRARNAGAAGAVSSRAGHGSGGGAGGGPAGRDGESADDPQAALEEIHVRSLPAGLGRTLALWKALVMPVGAGPGGGRERWREGERLKWGSPLGGPRQPEGMDLPLLQQLWAWEARCLLLPSHVGSVGRREV